MELLLDIIFKEIDKILQKAKQNLSKWMEGDPFT